MSVHATAPAAIPRSVAPRIPDADALIGAARDLIPMLRRLGPRHDAERRLSDEAAGAIREAGFFRICQSIENGGYGLPPSVLCCRNTVTAPVKEAATSINTVSSAPRYLSELLSTVLLLP